VEHGIAIFMLYETFHPLPAYLPQAAARLRAGMAAGADRPDARVALGRALLAMDSLAAAERVLADALDRDSTDAYAALWLGVARIQRADGGAAAEALTRAVRLAPHLTEARLKLAEALTRAGRLQPAAEVLDEALRRDPVRHAAAWNDLGFLRLQLGNTRAALAALRRSVALDPRLPTARVNLGSALLASMDLDAAGAQFERALAIDPANQAALGNLGVVRGQQGRTADARRLFERLLALNPADARAAAYLADLSR
jgi:tetratricopeptide (TPR) repeat protein